MFTILDKIIWHNSILTWLLAAGTIAAIGAVLYFARHQTVKRLKDVAPRTPALWDDVVLEIARRTSNFFIAAVGVAVASYLVAMPDKWDGRLRTAVVVICVLQAGMWGNAIVRYTVMAVVDRHADPRDVAHETGKNMLRFLGMALVWAAVTLLCLDNLGVNVTTLITGLGVTGVAVALATQNIVGDLFASISILLDKPFLVGDFIILDTYLGTVERIGIKTTRVRSLGGEEIVFANSDLIKGRLRNYKSMRERRVVFTFGVAYGTPTAALAKIGPMVRDIVNGIPKARFDRAHLAVFDDKMLKYEVVYYVLDPDYNIYMDVQQAINLQIYERLDTDKVSMWSPSAVLTPPSVIPGLLRDEAKKGLTAGN